MPDGSILKAFLTLGMIVAALGVTLFFVKKYVKKNKKVSGTDNLEIVSRISLQPKTHLFIVNVGDKKLLLGATDHSVNTLADLTSEGSSGTDEVDVEKALQRLGRQAKSKMNKPVNKVVSKMVPAIDDNDSLSFTSFLKSTFKKQVN